MTDETLVGPGCVRTHTRTIYLSDSETCKSRPGKNLTKRSSRVTTKVDFTDDPDTGNETGVCGSQVDVSVWSVEARETRISPKGRTETQKSKRRESEREGPMTESRPGQHQTSVEEEWRRRSRGRRGGES